MSVGQLILIMITLSIAWCYVGYLWGAKKDYSNLCWKQPRCLLREGHKGDCVLAFKEED